MTILALFLYALLLLVVSLLGDRTAVNEIRWRLCKLWHTQVKWRLGK